MRYSRLLGITTILLSHDTVTAEQLAKRYEVSVRTIYRDIEALSAAGVPVYMRQGKGGGISLVEDYTVSRAMLSDEDARYLILALQAMKATDFADSGELIDKIRSVFKMVEINDWVEIEFSNWSNSQQEREKFEILKNSILNSEIMELEYINASGEKSEREVSPLKLIFKSRAWYLIAYCSKRRAVRMFRASRIISATPSGRHFDRASIPLEKIPETKYAPDIVSLHLKFSSDVLYRLYDEFSPDMLKVNDDGSIDVKVRYPRDEWIYSFILSMGDSAEVISPKDVRDEIARRTSSILKKYIT